MANQDIKDSASWYELQQKGLGRKFIGEIREKVYFIRQYPESFTVKYGNIRTAVLINFPFMIHYFIDDINKIIVITAVLHMSRNPNVWQKR
ncbi:MAG: type II toxin-antitoxin system RelE/ParE family toxin [Prolixibacteraceae bacterium]